MAFLSCSPISSRRSASEASTAALIAAIRLPSGASRGVATANASAERDSAVESQSARADFGELGEELSDLACLLGAGEVEEAVHFVVGDVGEQRLSGGAGIERATGVGTRDERQAGGFFTHKVGEDDGVPDAHPDEDSATEHLAQLGHELVIKRERGQLVRASGQDERARPEVETAVLFDEIAARKKAVGQLLDGALRRAHGSLPIRPT